MNAVALITDFGAADWYVAAMKGRIIRAAPGVPLVDITHEIPPGDVRQAAFILSRCWPDFPPGTVFLAVVDPGVGGSRAPAAIHAGDCFFIGPNNGLFSFLAAGKIPMQARRLENPAWRSGTVSATFHGRDIFAPAAARLARGEAFESAGAVLEQPFPMAWPAPRIQSRLAAGEILHIDHFGNAITSLPGNLADSGTVLRLAAEENSLAIGLRRTYSDVPPGEPLAYAGSSGLVEIAVRGGHAARQLGLRVGGAVNLEVNFA